MATSFASPSDPDHLSSRVTRSSAGPDEEAIDALALDWRARRADRAAALGQLPAGRPDRPLWTLL